LPAWSSTRIFNPSFLNHTTSYDVARYDSKDITRHVIHSRC
jgi:hypothetical protein